MADISMCNNEGCPSFEKCYRAQAIPSPRRQAFTDFKVLPGNTKCDSFWEIQSGNRTEYRPGNLKGETQ